MKRLIGLLLLLPLPALGAPSSLDLANLMKSRGNCTLNLETDCGVTRGVTGAAMRENYIACQNAISAFMIPNRPPGTPTLLVPFMVHIERPITIDTSDVKMLPVQGAQGAGFRCYRADGPIFLGISRAPLGQKLTTQHFPMINGRYCYDILDSHLAQKASLCSIGTGYYEHPQLTIDFIYHDKNRSLGPFGSFFGFSDAGAVRPFILNKANDNMYFEFETKTDHPFRGKKWVFRWNKPATTGSHTISIQIDLTKAAPPVAASIDTKDSVIVWQDGKRITDFLVANYPVIPDAKLRLLKANDNNVFMLGASGRNGLTNVSEYFQKEKLDFILMGLEIFAVPRYKSDNTQTRLDGAPITEQNRCFSLEPGSVWFVALNDPPQERVDTRYLTIQGGATVGYCQSTGLVLQEGNAHYFATTGGYDFSDLSFSSFFGAGCGILQANVISSKFTKLAFGDLGQGIGSIGTGANYYIDIDGCLFNCNDAALDNYYGSWNVTNCKSHKTGRTLWRNGQGDLYITNWEQGYQGSPQTFLYQVYGGRSHITRFGSDFEDMPSKYPTVACYYSEAAGGSSVKTGYLSLLDITMGTVRGDIPIVWLTSRSNSLVRSAIFKIDNFKLQFSKPGWWVRTDSPSWIGVIEDFEAQPAGLIDSIHVTPSPLDGMIYPSNITIRDNGMKKGPPMPVPPNPAQP